jgi:hypothetical protein
MTKQTEGAITVEEPTKITHINHMRLPHPMTPGELLLKVLLPAALIGFAFITGPLLFR